MPNVIDEARGHVCVQNKDDAGIWAKFRTWYLPLLHLIYSLILFSVFISYLDNGLFLIGSRLSQRTTNWHQLYQSDITTIISVALVGERMLVSAWQSLIVWRCAFMLLEKSSLKMLGFSRLISWGIPTRAPNRRYAAYVIIILALTWPSQFASPVLTGSVLWLPANDDTRPNSGSMAVPVAGPGDGYDQFIRYLDLRRTITYRAMAAGNLGPPITAGDLGKTPPAQRMLPLFSSYHPKGTLIHNMTVPWISIDRIQWIADPANATQFDPHFLADIRAENSSTRLSISGISNPPQEPVLGNVGLLRKTHTAVVNWTKPILVKETAHVAVLVNRYRSSPELSCSASLPSPFGSLPTTQFVQQDFNYSFTHCYAVAAIRLMAGVIRCDWASSVRNTSLKDCTLANSTSKIVRSSIGVQSVQSDPMVDIALSMTSETVRLLASTSALYYKGSQKGQLEHWMKDLVTRGYQATWSVLTQTFGESINATAQYSHTQPCIQLSLVLAQVYVWLGLNILLTVASIFLFFLLRGCEVKPVNDIVLTAVLLDSSRILASDSNGLCNASNYTEEREEIHTNDEEEKDLKVRRRIGLRKPASRLLTHEEGSVDSSAFHHHELVLVEEKSTSVKGDEEG